MEPRDEVAALRQEVRRLRWSLAHATLDLPGLLRLRGFRIHSKEPQVALFIPGPAHRDSFYEMMSRYSFRLFLRDVIKHQKHFTARHVARYATEEITGDYLAYALDVGLIEQKEKGYRAAGGSVTSFGPTLEWFVAEVMKREFAADTLWGIKFKGQRAGGDYDIMARADNLLVYIEVKSSPPKQVQESEIGGFLERTIDLNPEVAVFLMDTELRMKDKIVPMFEDALARLMPSPPPVRRIEMELFQIAGRTYIINARHSIAGNMEKVLAHYFKSAGRWLP
jgi:hypothetical protein